MSEEMPELSEMRYKERDIANEVKFVQKGS
jgi:hypothetical protein